MDPKNQRGAIGPMVGLVIILGIILAGGIYFYTTIKSGNEYDRDAAQTANTSGEKTGAELDMAAQFSAQSTSTDPSAIEQDLNSVNASSVNTVGTDL